MNAQVVASPFAHHGDRSAQNPNERVRPVDGRYQPQEHVPGIVAPPHVRQLVQQDRISMTAHVHTRPVMLAARWWVYQPSQHHRDVHASGPGHIDRAGWCPVASGNLAPERAATHGRRRACFRARSSATATSEAINRGQKGDDDDGIAGESDGEPDPSHATGAEGREGDDTSLIAAGSLPATDTAFEPAIFLAVGVAAIVDRSEIGMSSSEISGWLEGTGRARSS